MDNIICKNTMTNEILIIPEDRIDKNLVDTHGYIFDKNSQMSEVDYERLDESLRNTCYNLSPNEVLESFQGYMKDNYDKSVKLVKCHDMSLPTGKLLYGNGKIIKDIDLPKIETYSYKEDDCIKTITLNQNHWEKIESYDNNIVSLDITSNDESLDNKEVTLVKLHPNTYVVEEGYINEEKTTGTYINTISDLLNYLEATNKWDMIQDIYNH